MIARTHEATGVRRPRIRSFFVLLALAATGVTGPAPSVGAGDVRVVACESLAALRRLSAASGEDRTVAAARIGTEPGCRLVARDAVGAVEQRAMFGGAPYECRTVADVANCRWILP